VIAAASRKHPTRKRLDRLDARRTPGAAWLAPLARWDAPSRPQPPLLWSAQLDDRWLVEVRATGAARGVLLLFDRACSFRLSHTEPVALRLGAAHGPSVDDLDDWQARSVAWADGGGHV
jgi:hypothetical protein